MGSSSRPGGVAWPSIHLFHPAGARRLWRRAAMVAAAVLTGGGLLAMAPAAQASAQPPPPMPGFSLSAAAQSASQVWLAYTATNSQVYVRNAAQQGTQALGGRLIGGPAIAVAPAGLLTSGTPLVVFGRGTDNALWWRYLASSGWTAWRSLGGIITSNPAAATAMTNQFGQLNVFARGQDGALWYRVLTVRGWQRWTLFGGRLLAGTGPGGTTGEVAVTGTDGKVSVLGRTGTMNGLVNFGGQSIGTPGVSLVQSAFIVVAFARGTDNALWYKTSPLPLSSIFAWHSLGGVLTSGVTASTVPGGKTYVFALGTGNQIWMRAGTWPALGPWTRL
jgi:hypothetical protein